MRRKHIAVAASFLGVLFLFSIIFFISPDQDVSVSERRKLIQFKTYAEEKALNGRDYGLTDYFSFLEDYALDQFPARDTFRSIKSVFKKYVLLQKDNNGYYYADGTLCRMDETLSEKAITDSVNRFNALYQTYFKGIGGKAYYSLIPDKNYFVADKNGYLHYDYDKMYDSVRMQMNTDIHEIPVDQWLSEDEYYVTDPHWDQTKILGVADELLEGMGAEKLASDYQWTAHEMSPFYGTYYGQAALPVKPDRLIYLTGEALEGVTVYDHNKKQTVDIYDEERFSGVDPYDVFLGGAVPLLTIRNSKQTNGKQLVIFRDSFGSSLAPLLVSEYSEVLVIDIRYISPRMLTNSVRFKEKCDVLFLYSTSVLNTYGIFAN